MRVGTLELKPKSKSGILNNSLKEVVAMLKIKATPKTNNPIIAALFFVVRCTPFLVSCLKLFAEGLRFFPLK